MVIFEIFYLICLLQRNTKLVIFNYFENNIMEIVMIFLRMEKLKCIFGVYIVVMSVFYVVFNGILEFFFGLF